MSMNQPSGYPIILATLRAQERSQSWLARRLGVSVPYVSLVLRGLRPMPDAWRSTIADALNVPEFLLFLDSASIEPYESSNAPEPAGAVR